MMWVSSLATTTCLLSGLNHATSGALNVWPAARSPARGNCHRFRPLESMMSTRLPFPSAISTGPGSTEGSEPGASQPGPVAVREIGALAATVTAGAVDAVAGAVVALLVVAGGKCEAIPLAAGFGGVSAEARSHQEPTLTLAISATSSPRTSRQCRRSSGDGASRC